MIQRAAIFKPLTLALTVACMVACNAGFANAQAPQRHPTVILGPSAVYGRGYSPAMPRAAGFSYQAGYAAPAVVPNYANPGYQPAFTSGASFSSGPVMPYGAAVYGSTYPGYGFGFGSGYGALGYNFNYPGAMVGYGYLGTNYPTAGFGFVSPTWYYQQMQGYYR